MKTAIYFLTALLALTMPLQAADDGRARVNVTLIIASNQGNDFDIVNDAYRDQLLNLFSYTAYTQTDEYAVVLDKSQRRRVDMPGGYELLLTLQDVEDGRVFVQAVIRKGNTQYLDTVLSILRPGVVFVGGPPMQEGVIIIVLETGF